MAWLTSSTDFCQLTDSAYVILSMSRDLRYSCVNFQTSLSTLHLRDGGAVVYQGHALLSSNRLGVYWVAVKELILSFYIGVTCFFTICIYTHYGNLSFP